MAPPSKVSKQQLETMVDCLEQNRDMSKGLRIGAPPSLHQAMKHKWVQLAKTLNAIAGGSLKTPEGWKRYWFEWRYRCRKRNAGVNSGSTRFVALSELEIRTVELNGIGTVKPPISKAMKVEDLKEFLAEDSIPYMSSGSEHTHKTSKGLSSSAKHQRRSMKLRKRRSPCVPKILDDDSDDTRADTPPPKWAIKIEERKIAADERMADALASMVELMRSQEERRTYTDTRIADTLASIAGSVQDLNSGVHDVVQHLHQLQTPPFEDKPFPINKIFTECK